MTIKVGTKIRVRKDISQGSLVDLYGLKRGDEVITCAQDGWREWDIWVDQKENPHVDFETEWAHCRYLCVAAGEKEFYECFEVVEDN